MKHTKKLPPAVLALIGLSFALGSCEYVVVAILPDIAAGLDASLGAVGKLVGVFAAGYAVGTPLLTAAAGRVPNTACSTILYFRCTLYDRYCKFAKAFRILNKFDLHSTVHNLMARFPGIFQSHKLPYHNCFP